MNNKIHNKYLLLLFVTLILISGCAGCLGSPEFTIIIENKTGITLTIYIEDIKVGDVDTGNQINYDKASWDYSKYPLKATNAQGDMVFEKTLTRDDMVKVKSMVYEFTLLSDDLGIPEI